MRQLTKIVESVPLLSELGVLRTPSFQYRQEQ